MSIFDDNLKNTYVEGCLAELQRQIDNLTPVLDNSYVKFTPQALTTPEKEQARTNIGAGAIIDNGVYLNEIAFGDSATIEYDITLGVLSFSLVEDYAKTDASNIDVDEFKTALGYTAEDIVYDNASSGLTATDVQNAIDEIVSSMGGGTASDISYDNTGSGLTATNVQSAIDEIVAGMGGIDYKIVWTNPNAYGTFNSQTVTTLDVSGYTYFLVLAKEYGAAQDHYQYISGMGKINTPSGDGVRLFCVGDYGRRARSFRFDSSTQMYISEDLFWPYNSNTVQLTNTHLYPLYVIAFNL